MFFVTHDLLSTHLDVIFRVAIVCRAVLTITAFGDVGSRGLATNCIPLRVYVPGAYNSLGHEFGALWFMWSVWFGVGCGFRFTLEC